MSDFSFIKKLCPEKSWKTLSSVQNKEILSFVDEFARLCEPDSVFVRGDDPEDVEYIRQKAVTNREEKRLKTEGHTVHFDGPKDQARDKANTKFLVGPNLSLPKSLNIMDKEQGTKEVLSYLKGSMKGKEMYVLFLGLGPVGGEFSLYAVQITDSAYVAHSEDILYRPAYGQMKRQGGLKFFRFVHSAGRLDERGNSIDIDKRRVYIDLEDEIVYSSNTQYAGNTVGMKKLALRLAINRASKEGWLAEHMFLMSVNNLEKNRKSFFSGAFPSACGKTSTCMVDGETVLGDDISYLRRKGNAIYAVNVERGIFGIIKDVNPKDDPVIWDVLSSPGEIIFSNVLVNGGVPYWQGDGRPIPEKGENFAGPWHKGKADESGKEIPYSHPNARYTIRLSYLKNCDNELLENPGGVKLSGLIFGGRDSDTWVPVFESFDWMHGVITMASCLESETTAATIGKEGVRKFNPMANLDFLSIPIGTYIENYLKFVEDISDVPKIFGVNYFQKDAKGKYLTGMHHKKVWLKWMELRVYDEAKAIETPVGMIPVYDDLKVLFEKVLKQEYTAEDYEKQFSINVDNWLAKLDRMREIYSDPENKTPSVVFEVFDSQEEKLKEFKSAFGAVVSPFRLSAA